MKVAIVINKQRLTPSLEELLSGPTLREKYDIDYDAFYISAKDMATTLDEIKKQNYQALIIGGGDGTVRSAIQELTNTEMTIAILPLGTFNLLAKSLNYPNDIDALFNIVKNNKSKLIDFIGANDTMIINHAWIGFYYYILKLRAKHKQLLGKSKLLKSIFNTLALFRTLPVYFLELQTEGKKISYKTCLVYIGNNEFYKSIFDIGERKTLSSGLMSVTILNAHTRWQLFLCMLDLLFGKTRESKYITYFCTDKLVITAKQAIINMVIDGELFKMTSPVNFENYHNQLKVFVP